MSTGIEGKVVVITGASSGLGESTARHLAALGATVVLGARRKDRLDAIVRDITAKNGKALAVRVDVTKREQVDALIQAALEAYGKVNVLVNNAGVMPIAPLAALQVDEWEKMIDINIKGVLYGIAAALPVFTKAKNGHFINLSSVAGMKVFAPGGSVYSGTKFAVHAISEGLRNGDPQGQHPRDDPFARCCRFGTEGREFGCGGIEEREGVLQDRHSGRLRRPCDCLRDRTTQ